MDRFLPPGIVQGYGETARWFRCDWMLPGQLEAIAPGKAFCEGQVRDGIGAGAGRNDR
ncbi:hypothetical protein ACFL9U_10490 [Thermodesulfobacteriota bacterium]